jgi:cobalamin biosynthetic protein CobC
MSAELPRHGGDLAFAAARYGEPAGGWLDLSTGINPHPYAVPDLPAEAYTRLPQPAGLEELEATARLFYGVPPGAGLVAMAGSETAIRLLPLLLPEGAVALAMPTYRTHGEAWTAAGRTVAALPATLELPAASRIAVVVNPNNPDGRTLDRARLSAFAGTLAERDGVLVIDEAYADLDPDRSAAALAADLPVVVLRSFGKFFGLPGLRLGFMIGPPHLAARLRQLVGDWPVSGPALVTALGALRDIAWIEANRSRIAAGEARLLAMLDRARLAVVGRAGLFVLAADREALPIHEALARHGIWTRIFPGRPEWLRIGLPPSGQFDRLEAALKAIRR